ncbi:ATP-binding protein [Bifidobacterium sp. MA2]|uniref:ATP-binding protein n=1 Tax=Bifidobacterium santillanense TaxID=2809028 RepID=A0ABS5UP92_9BIFI|nr:ATP-binding protein [Bifidobacterium santillanense]MBT1172736.1 ATP-binding protein [Bifidobacterium santillanense]
MVARTANPFKPTAGRMPPLLIGRDGVVEDFEEGLDDGPGAPGRLMRVTGARGVGKTVILTEFGRIAKARKWEVVDETASDGLSQRLLDRLAPDGPTMSLSLKPSVSLAGLGGVSLGEASVSSRRMPLTLREAMGRRLDALERRKAGLLVTIDEAQAADRDDMVAIATAVQHLIREERNVAFVFAGLPTIASKWLNDEVLTFLRRAQAERLGDIPLDEVEDAFVDTFDGSGMSIGGEALRKAVEATQGYPFMIQLVGYHIWRIAYRRQRGSGTGGHMEVGDADADAGVANALDRLGDAVHGPELDGLSPIDKTYLLAMAQDDGPSSTSAVAERMGKDVAYANVYRTRLIDAQVIRDVGYGKVDFAIPYLRRYLREHAACIRMNAAR